MHLNDILFDRKHIWHPYSSITNPLKNYPIISANGFKLTLNNGRKIIDGMSSWWAAIHGYNHPVLNNALIKQIKLMSHVMFGGITHYPAIKLCKNIIKLVPKKLECIFLADSGSVAIEVAIKMVLQYWQLHKNPRKKFLSFYKGYHGDTFGAMSICDPYNSMHKFYHNFLPKNYFINSLTRGFHEKWKNGDDKDIIFMIEKYNKKIAAVIIEPIVQSAGGMIFYHASYLKTLRELCNYYNIILIFDEIATGFGRTGKLFACNHANISPDIMCIGKALTGGMVTLSATLSSRHIAETISNGPTKCFMHGPTFMGNPLACSAANASLFLLKKENWNLKVSFINKILFSGLISLNKHKRVKNVRVLGAIGVVETFNFINIEKIQKWFVNYGVWIRPFRKLIYLMPPYIINKKSLFILINAISESLDYPEHFLN
ncbi:adenosylmethionine--8-amino-7-oxononanoate transaminase [Sodalis-like secondary symbiont of Drepanosiphum platanoidis]|uniref:adenosylmethionine--8-amino-7-oxononanoate transaminase n=1 Tax=Sodalis-like secondary symbiont of Drepanosiphum platanoidis TaxID=2994493 RepID=UPI00346451CB